MRSSLFFGLPLAIGLDVVQANTEKVIFLGPDTVSVPTTPPTLQDLRLDVLTPDNWSKRVDLQASFPTDVTPSGTATWVLLTNLTKDQRYELRVCWAATQPTAFSLDVFELPVVWDTPELITSLATYAFSRQSDSGAGDAQNSPRTVGQEREASLLFLRVLTAADYYTDNATLMANVEPVRVDLVLDPFLLNALPRSLLPAIVYIIAVGVMAWFLSRLILIWMQPLLAAEGKTAEKKRI